MVDDTALVQRAKQGSQAAFGELALRYRSRIYGVLLRLTRDAAEAENLCQDVFLKAFLALHKFEERSAFSTWLYRIAVNLGLNHAERHKRIVPWDQEVHEDLLRVEPPEAELEQLGELQRLRAAIDELPPRQKATVLLRDVEGLSFEQVAEALECAIGTAKANHFHALRNLRKRLAPPPAEAGSAPARISGVTAS